jgi:hypothetical protein
MVDYANEIRAYGDCVAMQRGDLGAAATQPARLSTRSEDALDVSPAPGNGEGVHFGEDLVALAKDNVVDTSVISEVAGVETIGGHS